MMAKNNTTKLWTKNYTCFALCDFFEEMSDIGVTFAISLFVLDYFNSVFLYGLYLGLYYISSVIIPLLAGPIVARNNKIKINVYCCALMLVSTIIYTFLLMFDLNNIVLIVIFAIGSGIIQTIFMISKNSLLKKVVYKDNLQKASSINNVIETCAAVTAPIATILYENFGLFPIMIVCIVFFVLAMIIGTLVKDNNEELINEGSYKENLNEEILFCKNNKLFFVLLLIFMLIYFKVGSNRTVFLPFFKDAFVNGYLWYVVVTGLDSTGECHASFLMYFIKIKKDSRYKWLLSCLIIASVAGIFTVNNSLIIACITSYLVGLTCGIINNLKLVLAYEKLNESDLTKFFSLHTTFTNAGNVVGILFAGTLSKLLSLSYVNAFVGIIGLIGTIVLLKTNNIDKSL